MWNIAVSILILTLILCPSCSRTSVTPDYIKIQELNDFTLDGNPAEWKDIPSRQLYADPFGNFPGKEDLKASFKLAWKRNNLLLFVEIEDDCRVTNYSKPWRGDGIELFLTDFQGSENIVQYSVALAMNNNELHYKIRDLRKQLENAGNPSLRGIITGSKNKVNLELEFNYQLFGETEYPQRVCFQLYVNDVDNEKDNSNNQLTWHPLGHSYINSFANFILELTESENSFRIGTSRVVVTDNELIDLYVFGSKMGDKITVKSRDNKHFEFTSSSTDPQIPQKIKLSGFDPEQDTAIVFINEEFIFLHDLFLSTRRSIKTEPNRFDREIRLFKQRDKVNMPEAGGVLFVGSSSIRRWNTLKEDFAGIHIIPRGFGGSTSADALQYMDQIVLPYNPSAIVYYEGDNDLALGLSYDEIISNMERFVEKAINQNPQIKIFMISPKPSLSRIRLWERYLELHRQMKKLTERYSSVYFVDVASPMFNNDGKLREELFIEDGIHMNKKGYDIWENILKKEMFSALSE